MAKFLKGQNVKLCDATSHASLLSKETSCSLSFNVNTIDASNKGDNYPEYETPEYESTELSAQVSGNIASISELRHLMFLALGSDAKYSVSAILGTNNPSARVSTITLGSTYYPMVTSLEIDMPADGLATVNMSIECGSDFSIILGN